MILFVAIRPGFPLYQVIADSLSAEVKKYDLKPECNWECDLEHMESLITDRTRAILINNPSNPCGSNYSATHLEAVVAVARKHGLPIIADEIYAGVVFDGEFTPINTVSGDVPVLSTGGIAKEFIVPGWRLGWVTVHDQSANKVASELLVGLKNLSQLILGANSLIQSCLPRLLLATDSVDCPQHSALAEWKARYMRILSENAALCVDAAAKSVGLEVTRPQGAMYTMMKVNVDCMDDEVKDDTDFARLLLLEENISVLPGQCFGMPNFIRLVICPPPEMLTEAFDRISAFIERHKRR